MARIAEATLAVALIMAMVGCEQWSGQPGNIAKPREEILADGEAKYLRDLAVRGDEQTDSGSAVQSALQWARKYTEKSEEADRLLEENQLLKAKNTGLMEQVASLEAELVEAQRELKEANAMLIEQREELLEWKRNVLGYRDEIRQAQQAQLQALAQVLRLLGGEVEAGQPTTQPAASASAREPKDAQAKELSRAPGK